MIDMLVNSRGKAAPGATYGGLGLLALEVVLAGIAKNVEARTASGYARWAGNNEMGDYLEAVEIAHSFKSK